MKTIDEIRARVGEHEECLVILRQPHDPKSKEQRAADDRRMSPEAYQIAVVLLAEIERLDTDCDRYAGAWKRGRQEIAKLKEANESLERKVKLLEKMMVE